MKRRIALAAATIVALTLWRRPRYARTVASALGRRVTRIRCGDARLASNDPIISALPRFDFSSDGFADGGQLQAPYVGISGMLPPLAWSGQPAGTVELALIVEDIDVPLPGPLVHAIAYGVDPARRTLPAGAIPPPGRRNSADPGLTLGRGAGGRAYLPPTPIPGHGAHRYVFQAFALRKHLAFDRPPNKARLVAELRDAAVARAIVIGVHEVR